jgi:hypothetical protein
VSLASISFMYWYQDHGGSSPARTFSCAQSRTRASCFFITDLDSTRAARFERIQWVAQSPIGDAAVNLRRKQTV